MRFFCLLLLFCNSWFSSFAQDDLQWKTKVSEFLSAIKHQEIDNALSKFSGSDIDTKIKDTKDLLPLISQALIDAPEIFKDSILGFWGKFIISTSDEIRHSLPASIQVLEIALNSDIPFLPKDRISILTRYGTRLENIGQYYQAKAIYKKVINFAGPHHNYPELLYPFAISPLAKIYIRLGENKSAKILLEECLTHYLDTLESLQQQQQIIADAKLKKAFKKYLNRAAYAYLELGNAEQDEDNIPQALVAQNRGLALLEKYAAIEQLPDVQISLLINKANCLLLQEDLPAVQSMLTQMAALEPEDKEQLFHIDQIWGKLALMEENFDLAENLYTQSLDSALVYYSPQTQRREIGQIEISLGEVALRQQQWDKARQYFQNALSRVLPNYQEKTIYALPDAAQFYPENVILEALDGLGEVFRHQYQERKQLVDLEQTQKAFALAIEMENVFIDNYVQQASQLQLLEESHDRHEQMLLVLKEKLKQIPSPNLADTLFFYLEKSRANLFRRQLADKQVLAKVRQKISEEKLQEEIKWQEQIDSQMDTLAQLRAEGVLPGDVPYKKVERQLFEARENLRNQREAYFALDKKAAQPIELATLKKQLPDDKTLLLEYFYGQDSIYLAVVSKENPLLLSSIFLSDSLKNTLDRFYFRISDEDFARTNDRNPEVYQTFMQDADFLYRQLLAPAFPSGKLPHKVVLIPDGPLQSLPFHLLLTQTNPSDQQVEFDDLPLAYARLPYFFRSCELQYGSSATVVWKDVTKKNRPKDTYLGMVPDYSDCSLRSTAASALNVLSQIAQEESGQFYGNQQASKTAFTEQAGQFRYLHFHGHSFADQTVPMMSWLAFSCEKTAALTSHHLSAYEIYDLPLATDLLFLGACNTGVGKVAQGEGVFSMERAFRYAGVRNIVMTLWEADDEATVIFSKYFFEALPKQANQFGEVLTSARESYLAQAKNNAYPYYWGAFALTGEKPTSPSSYYWLYYLLGGLVLIWVVWKIKMGSFHL